MLCRSAPQERQTLAEFHFGSRCAAVAGSAPHSRGARATRRRRAHRALEHRFARETGRYREFRAMPRTAITCSRACIVPPGEVRGHRARDPLELPAPRPPDSPPGLPLLAARLELPRGHHRGRGRGRALSALQRRPLQRGGAVERHRTESAGGERAGHGQAANRAASCCAASRAASPARRSRIRASCRASLYPPRYGLRSPMFARAALVPNGRGAQLLVSGTASIVGPREPAHRRSGSAARGDRAQFRGAGRTPRCGPTSGRPRASSVRLESLKVYLRNCADYAPADPADPPAVRGGSRTAGAACGYLPARAAGRDRGNVRS